MEYAFEKLAQKLKAARERKGISQRALSQRTGMPQAQISKIENNAVDLRLSTLASLAHALDLEIELIPRKTLPAVQSISSESKDAVLAAGQVNKELARIGQAIARLQLNPEFTASLQKLREQNAIIAQLPKAVVNIPALVNVRKLTEAAQKQSDGMKALVKAVEASAQLRNRAVHALGSEENVEPSRPAYSLEDDDG